MAGTPKYKPVDVPIGPEEVTLLSKLQSAKLAMMDPATLKAKLERIGVECRLLKEIARSTAEAHGVCFLCNGTGKLPSFTKDDTYYPCPKSPHYGVASLDEAKVIYGDVRNAFADAVEAESAMLKLDVLYTQAVLDKDVVQSLTHSLTQLRTVRKYDLVLIRMQNKGNPALIGREARVMWLGIANNGVKRVGLFLKGEPKLIYLPQSFVQVLTHQEYVQISEGFNDSSDH